ncbi:MAG: hypothetical protein QFB86_03500 [Patescibacteria group bacterium]|nr:hypothetical protein [Patescibacteria group bacterium]
MKLITKLLKHGKRWYSLSLLTVDISLFGFTNPENVSSPLLIVAFLVLCINIFFAVYALNIIAGRGGFVISAQQRKAAYIGAGVFSVVIALQSIGQLTVRDIAVMLPFVVIGYLYVTYGQTSKQA